MLYKDEKVLPSLITKTKTLEAEAENWGAVVALDTEFVRTSTYYPQPGLYQVGYATGVSLIDPTSFDDWVAFSSYLLDPEIVKVMHSCSEDLELLNHHLQLTPENIFDTQLAYAFISQNLSIGYGNLVHSLLDVQLDKQETRSNWLKRPLTSKQLFYAQADVTYLLKVHQILVEKLDSLNRLSWFGEEMLRVNSYTPVAPEKYYLGLRKAWRLAPENLSLLKDLCRWRELAAQKLDVPRNRVVWDEHLIALADVESVTRQVLVKQLPAGVVDRFGTEITSVVEAHEFSEVEPIVEPLGQRHSGTVKKMRKVAADVAEKLNLAVELLARRRDVENCARHYLETGELSVEYQGWRNELVGQKFTDILQGLA